MSTKQDKQKGNKHKTTSSKNLDVRLPVVQNVDTKSEKNGKAAIISRLEANKNSDSVENLIKRLQVPEDIEETGYQEDYLGTKLDSCREKLKRTTAFLQTAVTDLKDIDIQGYRKEVQESNEIDFGDCLSQDDDEMDLELDILKKKVDNVRLLAPKRKELEAQRQTTRNFEETVNNVVGTFSTVEKGECLKENKIV